MIDLYPILAVHSFLTGASIASFLNVVIWRVPRGESIVSPPSHCPKCGNAVRRPTEAETEKHVLTYSTKPGTSEHQSGLCCDMHNLPSAMQSFANTEAYKWLYKHCADFGFILRYPQSKEDITEINFEPWHFRFVGRYHAQKIMESGLSLEEYVESIDL
jgi:hypothetical protein